jgi:CPA1 family monovalent cation:H+ antiporter
LARFIWVFPSTYLPRWLSPSLRKRDPSPPWQAPFAISFTGVRGVVSLAAALAIPLTIASGAPFPNRDMILFVTFGVIIVTLVGQGSMLPTVICWLGLNKLGREEQKHEHESELAARSAVLQSARQHLERIATERKLDGNAIDFLQSRHEHRLRQIPTDTEDGLVQVRSNNDLRMELIAAERDFLYELLREGRITDESRRRLERELDLEEATILSKREAETPL